MLFAIFCTDKDDHLDVSLANRPAHVDYLKALGDKLVFAGPTFAEDGESMNGGLIVVDMADRAEVDAFAAGDPYAKADLFADVTIRPWKKALP